MIEGLKITISGKELAECCQARVSHHLNRAQVYKDQADNMEQAKVQAMQYTNGDPVKALRDRQTQHQTDADELRFIACHIDQNESYLLSRDDLTKLGIIRNPWD